MNNELIDRIIKILAHARDGVASGDWYDGTASELPQECDAIIDELKKHKSEYNHDSDVPIIKG